MLPSVVACNKAGAMRPKITEQPTATHRKWVKAKLHCMCLELVETRSKNCDHKSRIIADRIWSSLPLSQYNMDSIENLERKELANKPPSTTAPSAAGSCLLVILCYVVLQERRQLGQLPAKHVVTMQT